MFLISWLGLKSIQFKKFLLQERFTHGQQLSGETINKGAEFVLGLRAASGIWDKHFLHAYSESYFGIKHLLLKLINQHYNIRPVIR